MTDPAPLPTGWVTDADDSRLPGLWPAAADYGDELTFPLLVAQTQCERFAPALAEGEPVPQHYVAGQILQTRSLIRAGIVGDGGGAGNVEDVVTMFPMDWTVKNLLRPERGRKYMGGKRGQRS